MENLSAISGYVASTLALFTLVAKDMCVLRTVVCNFGFVTYGTIEWLPPVLFLHLVLLPLNIVRLSEVIRMDKIADKPMPDGANHSASLRPAALCSI